MKKLSETYKELGIAFAFPIEIKDENGKTTYWENNGGWWLRKEYDANGKETYRGNSEGYWSRKEYDANGDETYYENSIGEKSGSPRSTSCADGKIIEVDGKKYQLKELTQ